MKREEIKKTIEQVVEVQYIAEDGTVFWNEEECKKYEESALFVVSKNLKKLSKERSCIFNLFGEGSEENEIEIFDIQNKNDLDNLKKYLYLKAKENGASECYLESCFSGGENENRKDYVFDGVTFGHEVIVFWSYDMDWFWVYKDGSLEGYFNFIRENYNKIIAAEEND